MLPSNASPAVMALSNSGDGVAILKILNHLFKSKIILLFPA